MLSLEAKHIGLIVLYVVCMFLLVLLLIHLGRLNKKKAKELENANKKLEESQKDLLQTLNELKRTRQLIESKEEEIQKLLQKQEELHARTNALHDDLMILNQEKQALIQEISQSNMLQLQDGNLDNLNELISEKKVTLGQLENDCREKIQLVSNLEKQNTDLAALIDKKVAEKNSFERQLNEIKTILDSLKTSYSSALKATERRNERYELVLTEKESHLLEMIKEIAEAYPELRTDLNRIGWSKIWLPKIQGICVREGLDKIGGIYKITLKSDETICYVGQAVNIKDRWYMHIKKMVGVEGKGNEKLYDDKYAGHPDWFWWEVVEVLKDDEKKINNDANTFNERERYYIELFACKEIGLNKK